MLYVAPLALNFLPEHVVADIVADLGTLCAAITNIFLDSDEGASFLVAVENCVEIKLFNHTSNFIESEWIWKRNFFKLRDLDQRGTVVQKSAESTSI